ncbi:hypothetical protein MGSAQ_002269 [marine sediment metagenome]|uniref:Uncharacterized protein n=1 Tax=marine sediment metagenome TaxID=412755 RepID=A0A1B6NRX2_9ZZZZ
MRYCSLPASALKRSNMALNSSYVPMPGFIIFDSTLSSECSGAIFR